MGAANESQRSLTSGDSVNEPALEDVSFGEVDLAPSIDASANTDLRSGSGNRSILDSFNHGLVVCFLKGLLVVVTSFFVFPEEFVFSEEVFLVVEAKFVFTVGHVSSGSSGSSV